MGFVVNIYFLKQVAHLGNKRSAFEILSSILYHIRDINLKSLYNSAKT